MSYRVLLVIFVLRVYAIYDRSRTILFVCLVLVASRFALVVSVLSPASWSHVLILLPNGKAHVFWLSKPAVGETSFIACRYKVAPRLMDTYNRSVLLVRITVIDAAHKQQRWVVVRSCLYFRLRNSVFRREHYDSLDVDLRCVDFWSDGGSDMETLPMGQAWRSNNDHRKAL